MSNKFSQETGDKVGLTRRNFIFGLFYLSAANLIKPSLYSEFMKKKDTKVNKSSMDFQTQSKVIHIYDKDVTNWDYATYPYVDFIDQNRVNEMVSEGIRELAGNSNTGTAWEKIFLAYKPNDKIAIKPNFNSIDHHFKDIITTPHVINAIIDGLIKYLRISEKNIFIYDLSRTIPVWFRRRIKYSVNYLHAYPETFWDKVVFHSKKIFDINLAFPDLENPIEMREDILDASGNKIKCYIPKLISRCDHLINIPVLKSHKFILTSCALKNHFGTVRFSNGSISPRLLHGKVLQKSLIDINANHHIKQKTRLIVVDGLFGNYNIGNQIGPARWNLFGESAGSPNSLFFSIDPIALESVIIRFLIMERQVYNLPPLSYEYLIDAANKGLGTFEASSVNLKFNKIKYIKRIIG